MERYDIKAAVRGTKQSFELMTDIGLAEPLALPVLQVAGAEAGKTLLVLAGVHGDEYEGVETTLRLFRALRPEALAGTVVLLPTANALSYRGGTRVSPEDGLNMARTFPGDPLGKPTERLAWHLHHRFIAPADFMLDLHSGGTHYAVSTLVGYCHNDATELGRRSRAAAEAFGAELLWAHEEIAPGRSVSSALALGVPWLYTEAYGGKRIRREDADLFYEGAFNLMRHLSMLRQGGEASRPDGEALLSDGEVLRLDGEALLSDGKTSRPDGEALRLDGETSLPSKPPAGKSAPPGHPLPSGSPMSPRAGAFRRIYGDGNFDGSETAEADGFFVPALALGSDVRAGGAVGAIYGFDGAERQRVVSARDGVVVMLPGTPKVRKGEPLFMVAPTEPVVRPG